MGAGETQLTLNGKQYVGVLSILDILMLLTEKTCDSLHQVKALACIGESLESLSLWAIPGDTHLKVVSEMFSKGVHRALVYHGAVEKGVIQTDQLQLCSQMDVVRFLKQHHVLSGTVEKLMHQPITCFSIKENMSVVIQSMAKNQFYAVPLVNEQGVLVATLSVSDFKSFLMLHEHDLHLVVFY